MRKGDDELRRRLSAALVELMQVRGAAATMQDGWQSGGPAAACPYCRAGCHPCSFVLCRSMPLQPNLLQAGTRSPILEWEKQYLLDNGVPPNAELEAVVKAISYFQ